MSILTITTTIPEISNAFILKFSRSGLCLGSFFSLEYNAVI